MREYELEVLEQYDIEVINTHKVRGAYFCETKEGLFLLKEAEISEGRASFMYQLQRHLESAYGMKVDTPLHTKEGELFSVLPDGTKYILKKWFGGRECDVRRERDILEASSHLALLHSRMNWSEETPLPYVGRSVLTEMQGHNRELKKVRTFVRNRVKKNEFEYRFLENFDAMYHIAQQVTARMASSEYQELYLDSMKRGALVHGSYNYHNILFSQGKVVVANFEHFRKDIQVQDLYYFLRKAMEKYQWEEQIGRQLLEAYESIRPLEKREKDYLALHLAYPEKFWKVVNAYANSNKAWISDKSLEKLQIAISQSKVKELFLEKIFAFHL